MRGLIVFHRLARYSHYEPFELLEWDWWSLAALARLPFSSVASDNAYAPFAASQVWDDVLSVFAAGTEREGGPDILYRGPLYGFAAAARGAGGIAFARDGAILDLDATEPDRRRARSMEIGASSITPSSRRTVRACYSSARASAIGSRRRT